MAEIKSKVFRSLGNRDSYKLDSAWIDNAIILFLYYPHILDAKEYSLILYKYSIRSDRQVRYRQVDFLNAWQNAAKISEFGHQALANSLAAFGKLRVKPNDHFLLAWYKQAEKILFESKMQDNMFTSQELANILIAFERLNMLPFSYFLKGWFCRAKQIINSFNTEALANSLMAFGKFKIRPQPMFLLAWYTRAMEIIDEFDSVELTEIIIAFERLDIPPGSVFFTLWQQQVTRIIDNFKHQELVNSLKALGELHTRQRLHTQPEWNFLSKWCCRAKEIIACFNQMDLVDSLIAFKDLEVEPEDAFLSAWFCQAEALVGSFNFTNLQKSMDICRHFNLSTYFIEEKLNPRVSESQLRNVNKRKYDNTDAEKPETDNKRRNIEHGVNKKAPKMTLNTQSFYAGNQIGDESADKPKKNTVLQPHSFG
ncbi:MAG: hypothetical protein V4496_03165 [Pseudomonadota bacterium]